MNLDWVSPPGDKNFRPISPPHVKLPAHKARLAVHLPVIEPRRQKAYAYMITRLAEANLQDVFHRSDGIVDRNRIRASKE